MYNEDLAIGLRKIFEEKDLTDLSDFISVLFKYVLNHRKEDVECKVSDTDKYLGFIENYFETKQINGPADVEDPYKVLKPCLDIMVQDQRFYELFAEKIENMEYSNYTREELVKITDTFMAFSDVLNIYFYGERSEEILEEESVELSYNLKNAIGSIVDELSVKEFLEIDGLSPDPLYDDVFSQKIVQMNDEEFFKYLLKTGEKSEIVEEKIEELNSPAVYSLYSSIIDSNYREEYDKLDYLSELRNSLIDKRIEKDYNAENEEFDEDYEYDPSKISIKLSKENINLIRHEKDFMIYLDKLSKLNNNEFILYLINNYYYINENEFEEEMNIINKRIKNLSDIELETLYSTLELYDEGAFISDDEMKKRNLIVEKKVENGETEYNYNETKHAELVAERERIYEEVSEFSLSDILPQEPRDYSYEVEKAINFCNDALIKSICELAKYDDKQCINYIAKVNQTETIGLYENACEDFAEELEGKTEKMTDKQLIENYKQRCKYQVVKYLRKRILSMPKKYLAGMIITNENGVFNDVIEMGLDEVRVNYGESR